jgi:AraC family transcriptional regulator
MSEIAVPNPTPPSICRCAAMTVVHFTGGANPGRRRAFDAIVIVVPGEGSTLRAGYRSAGGQDRQARVNGHQVSVIPANRAHSMRPGHDCDAIVIRLDRAFFERKAGEIGVPGRQLVERHAAVDPFLRAVGDELRRELLSHGPGASYLESVAAVVAVHLARHYCVVPTATPPYPGLPTRKLGRVQAYITAHFDQTIDVRSLAAVANLSAFHFARMFKRTTGQSPHLYITARRVERAKELLSSGALPLVDVAAKVGFQTQSHFTTVFHQYTGETPRMFRLRRRGPRAAGD